MEREIKFRALSMCKGERWVYGDLRHYARNPHTEKWTIHDPATGLETDIDETTIGQYTGLHDLNGKEIYEGDIVDMKRTPDGRRMSVISRHLVTCGNVADWCFSSLAFEVCASYSMCGFDEKYSIFNHRVEVIGNIHDNPELAEPYSLNLPAPKQRKKRSKGFQVEFVVSDNPKSEPRIEDNRIVYEVTREEMNEAIHSQLNIR